MNVAEYLERRRVFEASQPQPRGLCIKCFQPSFGCYCSAIRSFDPHVRFVILIHPIEVKRRIATGRMSHLVLQNSLLIEGEDYSDDKKVTQLVQDEENACFVLYPGATAANLTKMSLREKRILVPMKKKLTIFVIDGTWNTARKMIRSTNLRDLPKICFTPDIPSRFKVRKQPAEGCVSTIEAIHQTLELLGDVAGFDLNSRKHDALLDVFDVMVQRQMQFMQTLRNNRQLASKLQRKARALYQSVGK